MEKEKLRYAKNELCCMCKKPAVCFWPIVDIDIPEYPYCRRHVNEAKNRILKKISKN